jgi:hypothetical protein
MGKRGPKPQLPTPDQRRRVQLYAGLGIPQRDIAVLIGKSWDWVDKHCREELSIGLAETKVKVGGQIVRQALNGNLTAAIFYAKAQMGWRETNRFEHSGANGGPIRTIDLSRLLEGKSEEELRNLERALELLSTAGVTDGPGDAAGGSATGPGEAPAA